MKTGMTRTTLCALALCLALSGPAPAADKPPVTFDDVLTMQRLGLDEAVMLKRLADSPTAFVLSDEQVEKLEKAGVPAAVVRAMQRKRAALPDVGKLTDLAIVLDCSGSMDEKTSDGRRKMDVARKVVADLMASLPAGLRVTFVIYGHDAALKCKAVKVVQELAPLTEDMRKEMMAVAEKLEPAGHTPIALSIKTVDAQLAKHVDAACGMVLLTDGMETCHGDPAAEVRKLARNRNMSFGVHIVGFALSAAERKAVAEIAEAGKGEFYSADDAKKLVEVTKRVKEKVVRKAAAAKPVEEKVKSGGRTVLKIAEPDVDWPELEQVLVFEAGKGDGAVFIGSEKASAAKYDQPMRLAGGMKYDVWVRFAGNRRVKMVAGLEPEGGTVTLKPEKLLGLMKVKPADDLPKAKSFWVTAPGAEGAVGVGDVLQEIDAKTKTMVLPVGSYKVWLSPADGSKKVDLADKVAVKAGRVTVVD